MSNNRSMSMADYEKNDASGNQAEMIDWEENEDRRIAREKSLWQVSQSIATLTTRCNSQPILILNLI